MGASGVHVGVVNADGMVERVAGVDDEGYRRQTVNLNGRVFGGSGDAAGVFLAGGGRVYIGPRGTLGADSGIAIRTTGDNPKLYVDMNLDGRQLHKVIGNSWIINDVKLHDGATGATGNSAPNVAFDVSIRGD